MLIERKKNPKLVAVSSRSGPMQVRSQGRSPLCAYAGTVAVPGLFMYRYGRSPWCAFADTVAVAWFVYAGTVAVVQVRSQSPGLYMYRYGRSPLCAYADTVAVPCVHTLIRSQSLVCIR